MSVYLGKDKVGVSNKIVENLYKFGYVRPSNFPDLDSVANLPSGAYGVLVRSEIDNVEHFVASRQIARLYTVRNGALQTLKEWTYRTSVIGVPVTQNDTDEPVFIVWSNAPLLANNYNYPAGSNRVSARRYIEAYIIGGTYSANSANYINDAFGFCTNYTQKICFIGATINSPYSMVSAPAVKEIVFKDCTFGTTIFQVFCMNTPVQVVRFENCTHTAVVTNIDRMFYGASNIRSLDLSWLDFSGVTSQSNAFVQCGQLTDFSGINIKCSFSFATCVSLSHQSLLNIIDKLEPVDTATTLTLGAYNLAKLTAEEIAVATAKGWTVN